MGRRLHCPSWCVTLTAFEAFFTGCSQLAELRATSACSSIGTMIEEPLAHCLAKMRDAGISDPAMDNFSHYWHLCASGATGMIAEDTIRPLTDVAKLAEVEVTEAEARAALQATVMIKLNGGLGTSMGLDRAKTLLEVRDGRNFLDLIVAQVQHARQAYGARLPLIFMDSFRTHEETLAHLAGYPWLAVDGLPLDFLQNAEPKILASDLSPVSWPADSSLEWCPPGHGDLYPALLGSGLLDSLIAAGFRYACVANGDNLGAAPDATLAGWFAGTKAPYAAEICPRTVNDLKGGHLAVRISDGQLILRETAQTPAEDLPHFTDQQRHRYFHTNNLWLDLVQLREILADRHGVLGLPLIRNTKTVDPADPDSPAVIQLESAMGAAIEVFAGATAIVVPRDRFLPVKTTNELMLVRSDVFDLGVDGRLRAATAIPEMALGENYKLVDDFDRLVPVVPSLKQASALRVQGQWCFDTPAEVVGEVVLADTGQLEHYR